jgi:hypothetical protein
LSGVPCDLSTAQPTALFTQACGRRVWKKVLG